MRRNLRESTRTSALARGTGVEAFDSGARLPRGRPAPRSSRTLRRRAELAGDPARQRVAVEPEERDVEGPGKWQIRPLLRVEDGRRAATDVRQRADKGAARLETVGQA